MKLSIIAKLILAVVIITLVVGVGSVFLSVADQKNSITKLYFDRAISLANSLDAGISQKDLIDPETLKPTLLKFLLLNPEISEITIFKKEGEQFKEFVSTGAVSGQPLGSNDLKYISQVLASDTAVSYRQSVGGKDVLYLFTPLHISGQLIGTYKITVSLFELEASIASQARKMIIYIAVTILLYSLGAFFFVRVVITGPLNKLNDLTKSIEGGKFDEKANIRSNDEIGNLAQSFEKMSVKLHEYYLKLETGIKEKTAELEESKIDLENQQKALINVLEDVNQEKGVEESQSRSILENTNEGVILTNEKGEIKYINAAFEKMSGYSVDELKGMIFAEKVELFDLNEKLISIPERGDAAMVSTDAKERKYLLMAKTGQKQAVIINSTPVKMNGNFLGVVRIFHDFSNEAKLQKQKDDFFSIASHELRTPLTVISGNLDILSGYLAEANIKEDFRQLLKDTEESADRLAKMVEDFLNVSRLDQGRLRVELVEEDPCKLTQEVIKEIQPLAEKRGLVLNLACTAKSVKAKIDEDLFKEIIMNLVSNAIKFTSKGGIDIKQYVKDNQLYTTFTDTGMGIEEQMKDNLFQRFQQAMSRTTSREVGGTGLGLYISREFAKLMGGDLYLVKSEFGKGTVFELKLPLV